MTFPPRLLRVSSLIGLSVLLGGGLILPVAGLVLARDEAAGCCSKGRCCCAGDPAARDERTCLRRGCACEHGGHAVSGELVEAVLPSSVPAAGAPPAQVRWTLSNERPIARAQQPIVPPPRRSDAA